MVVLLVLGTIIFFLIVDAIRSMEIRVPRGTSYTTPDSKPLVVWRRTAGRGLNRITRFEEVSVGEWCNQEHR